MPNFYCDNKDCENYNVKIDINIMNFPYIIEKERIKILTCEKCNQRLKLVKNKSKFNPFYAKFNSLSDSEKRKILKERADNVYKKNGGVEEKMLKKKQAIDNMLKKLK